ncbi:hypothetical protein JB92DRAFT_2829716 [Gautieria morchelliformis]|nr:hypothetical protein JB92DRAFT_2829716 [Gautieria morchelliformis]
MNVTDDLERRMGINVHWTKDSAEYQEAVDFISHHHQSQPSIYWIVHAWGEIIQLNIEICHLGTWIRDEEHAIAGIQPEYLTLTLWEKLWPDQRKLAMFHKLPGYTGLQLLGVKWGDMEHWRPLTPLPLKKKSQEMLRMR